jgi:hypothetical protein
MRLIVLLFGKISPIFYITKLKKNTTTMASGVDLIG